MARSPAAVNGGWPPQRHPAEHDPRSARPAPAGQRPAQPGQQGGYPAHQGYPDPQAGYDPQQMGYHFPQQHAPQQHAPQQRPHTSPQQPNPRHGLSSLESAAGQQGGDYRSGYPSAPQGYGQPQQPQGFPSPNGHDPRGQPPQGYRPAAQSPAPFGGQPHAGQPNGHAAHNGLGDMRAGAPSYDQWQSLAPQQPQPQEPNPYDLGGYLPTGSHQPADPMQEHGEWGHGSELGYAEPEDHYQAAQLGYEPAHGGALEQAYGHDEAGEYEVEEPRRGSWTMRIAGAIVVAIGLGYGMAQGYKLVVGSAPDGVPPIVKGDSEPAKTLPTDPGGKQFAHTDSKVMGRLGEGSPSDSGSLASDADAGGTRRVQTLTVGRDGSISPPAGSEAPESTGAVAVPGLTVIDGFGGSGFPGASPSPPPQQQQQQRAEASEPVVVPPPSNSKPVEVAAVSPAATSPPPMPKKQAPAPAATPSVPAASGAPSGANGYVAVLASVPASGGSRLLALRKFADMQQQYGSVLQNKTPDVREANLGEKGVYHRLLVGPPGSRAQASSVCSELKTAGYKDCWVTAY